MPQGEAIDAHDAVVRLKRSWLLPRKYPQFYGHRTDYVCGSATVAPGLRNPGWEPIEYWAFVDSRHPNVDQVEGCWCNAALCREWTERYMSVRDACEFDARQTSKGELSDDHGHRHMSAGLYSILYAIDRLAPDTINLFGFDNVTSGTFDWSVTRGPDYNDYPDHNWQTERRMLDLIREEFACSINS